MEYDKAGKEFATPCGIKRPVVGKQRANLSRIRSQSRSSMGTVSKVPRRTKTTIMDSIDLVARETLRGGRKRHAARRVVARIQAMQVERISQCLLEFLSCIRFGRIGDLA